MDVRLKLTAARYSDRPFPAYRFSPGRNPHPTADPRGHSYTPPGQPQPRVDPVQPEQWAENGDYLYGCDLYNHAYWWEAHEVWEGLWHAVGKRSTQGRFLQGLIQISACHLKFFLGQPAGVRRLLESGTAYLQRAREKPATNRYMGLDVPHFLDSVHVYYDRHLAAAGHSLEHDLESYPFIRLGTDEL